MTNNQFQSAARVRAVGTGPRHQGHSCKYERQRHADRTGTHFVITSIILGSALNAGGVKLRQSGWQANLTCNDTQPRRLRSAALLIPAIDIVNYSLHGWRRRRHQVGNVTAFLLIFHALRLKQDGAFFRSHWIGVDRRLIDAIGVDSASETSQSIVGWVLVFDPGFVDSPDWPWFCQGCLRGDG
jgi:hypothetical protein